MYCVRRVELGTQLDMIVLCVLSALCCPSQTDSLHAATDDPVARCVPARCIKYCRLYTSSSCGC